MRWRGRNLTLKRGSVRLRKVSPKEAELVPWGPEGDALVTAFLSRKDLPALATVCARTADTIGGIGS